MEQQQLSSQNVSSHDRKLGSVICLIAGLCFYNLYKTASVTGNWKGAWFSVAHVALLGVAVFLSLREER